MRKHPAVIISLVERGWQAAWSCSLDLGPQGVVVVHLVKGWLRPSWRCLITPRPHIRVASAPRKLFWVLVGWWIARLWVAGRLRAILVDHEKSVARLQPWRRWCDVPVLLVRVNEQDGYDVWEGAQRRARSAWLADMSAACALR